MSIFVSNCPHCDEQQFQTHDFLSSKVRFIHTSTVTGSDSCSGKNTCTAYISFNINIVSLHNDGFRF